MTGHVTYRAVCDRCGAHQETAAAEIPPIASPRFGMVNLPSGWHRIWAPVLSGERGNILPQPRHAQDLCADCLALLLDWWCFGGGARPPETPTIARTSLRMTFEGEYFGDELDGDELDGDELDGDELGEG